ncbi:MAG: UDP-N-acetylglucosamine--N-acetylmuramyl-(pentapeptide) pyrophosphoryl-undecaprenol N-acetylglucosamine transferase, partial [Selenomonadaceae bacterium]|nr:UDP-N-acetylglucosamine--N-acetylmuramyl-(pentapeptide) pyrophosphoryl-undecaprenol N-acetylglucosamine transferase [Selenomonadaceae bacterium]
QFLHVTGKLEYEDVMKRLADAGVDLKKHTHIQVKPYLYNMPQALAVADLAIFRAGAIGLAELMARGIPSILIPYPYAAENHQEHNARAVMAAGASRMILNKDLDAESLLKVLHELLDHPDELEKMAVASRALGKPEAAGEIADMAIGIAK